MKSLQEDLHSLYRRSLNQLIQNLNALPDELLWTVPEGVTNSCGVLTQHLVGNLNHYIGHGIGNTGYIRHRSREFITSDSSRKELIEAIENLKETLDEILKNIEDDDLVEDFPLELPHQTTKRGALIHLYGHLTYHLGQINYLRRILSA